MGFWNFIEAGRSRSWAFGILQKLGEVEVGELRLTLKPTPELAFLFPNPAQVMYVRPCVGTTVVMKDVKVPEIEGV